MSIKISKTERNNNDEEKKIKKSDKFKHRIQGEKIRASKKNSNLFSNSIINDELGNLFDQNILITSKLTGKPSQMKYAIVNIKTKQSKPTLVPKPLPSPVIYSPTPTHLSITPAKFLTKGSTQSKEVSADVSIDSSASLKPLHFDITPNNLQKSFEKKNKFEKRLFGQTTAMEVQKIQGMQKKYSKLSLDELLGGKERYVELRNEKNDLYRKWRLQQRYYESKHNCIILKRDFNRNDALSKMSNINQEMKSQLNANSEHCGSTILPIIPTFAEGTILENESNLKEERLEIPKLITSRDDGIASQEYSVQLKDKIKILRKYKKKKMIEHLKEKMRKINCKSVEEPYSSDDSQIEYNGNKINKFEDILDSMDFSFKGNEQQNAKEAFEDVKQDFKAKLKKLNRNEIFEVLNTRKDRWNSNLGDKLVMLGMIDRLDTANKK